MRRETENIHGIRKVEVDTDRGNKECRRAQCAIDASVRGANDAERDDLEECRDQKGETVVHGGAGRSNGASTMMNSTARAARDSEHIPEWM